VGGHRKQGSTGGGSRHAGAPPRPKSHTPPISNPANQHTSPLPLGSGKTTKSAAAANQVKKIVVVFDRENSKGRLYAIGHDGKVALEGAVIVGGTDTPTPTGTFHASAWESNHVSKKYGSFANTPWKDSPLGLNAFGPHQLHLKELENRGIYLHGTMGPGWNPFTTLNSLISPASHGCIRMSNRDDIRLHDLLPSPAGTEVKISTDKADTPVGGGAP
jgi:lipoprotein-anchoring transpeptidase ErfK/SrfK